MDIVICEINLPDADGYEIARQVKKLDSQTGVILTTQYDPSEDFATKAREAGADFYISKPLQQGEILFAVHQLLRAAYFRNAIIEKNRKLEESLEQLKQFHQKLATLGKEQHSDKRIVGANLQEMMELNKQLEEKNEQISAMMDQVAGRFDSTESLLADIIELHQSEHRGHSERVMDISMFIAAKMKLTKFQIHNIKTAARLHELGIVALPTQEKRDEAIDEKKNRLISTHPLVGEMLLKSYPGFEVIADIIRHLHENVDGSGSPDGLFGDRIPIGSRIVSATSYFDHSRISSPDAPPEKILEKMEELAGKTFDDQVLHFLGQYLEKEFAPSGEQVIECSVFGLAEGMELAADLYSESGINLLKKGTVLSPDIISKVLRFHNMDSIAGNIKIKLTS
jgi:response regulator RpfG family c-di-GMP phosphodiesterase